MSYAFSGGTFIGGAGSGSAPLDLSTCAKIGSGSSAVYVCSGCGGSPHTIQAQQTMLASLGYSGGYIDAWRKYCQARGLYGNYDRDTGQFLFAPKGTPLYYAPQLVHCATLIADYLKKYPSTPVLKGEQTTSSIPAMIKARQEYEARAPLKVLTPTAPPTTQSVPTTTSKGVATSIQESGKSPSTTMIQGPPPGGGIAASLAGLFSNKLVVYGGAAALALGAVYYLTKKG